MNIRQADKEDLELLVKYTLAIHSHEDDGTIPEHPEFANNLKKWILLELENPRTLFLVAEINCCAVGFISATSIINDNGFLQDPIKGMIQLIWVDPANRKQKIAETLVENIENCFSEINIRYVECSYTTCNQLASEFWDALGYKANSVTARKIIDQLKKVE